MKSPTEVERIYKRRTEIQQAEKERREAVMLLRKEARTRGETLTF
jgi:hypothetical protein